MDLCKLSKMPEPKFDDFEDSSSSEDQMYLANINLSLTFFTGVNGSFDQLLPNNQACNGQDVDVILKDASKFELQNKPKMKKSSSMNFSEETNQIDFGPVLPLTQSSYDFFASEQNSINNFIEKKPARKRSPSGFNIIEDDDDDDGNANISLQEIHSSNKSKKKKVKKSHSLFLELDNFQLAEPFDEFIEICKTIKINPRKIGLLPAENWPEAEITFDQIVINFFQRRTPSTSKQDQISKNSSLKKNYKPDLNNFIKSNINTISSPMSNALKLAIKLYDALKISEISPVYESLVGVSWFHCIQTDDDEIIRINISRFSRLVGIDNGITYKNDSEKIEPQKILFDPTKGLLSYLGFKEMTLEQIVSLDSNADLFGIDLVEVKLIYHPSHLFRKSSTMSEILSINE